MLRKTLTTLKAMKGTTPLVVLTAYTAPVAALLDAHVDMLLVGDSLGMVLYGMESTLPVTLDMMIVHGKAVVAASDTAFVVVDMPFGSYQGSKETAFNNCARVIKETGCQAVKIEGGMAMQETIAFLVSRGIVVMAHIALMPQHVNTLGGYRYRGRNTQEIEQITQDALAVEHAGAFAVVLEGIEETLARQLSQQLTISTIGIGASPACDGQVLVTDDLLGLTPAQPKFVKKYADVAGTISAAVATYAYEVRHRTFPTMEHCFVNKK